MEHAVNGGAGDAMGLGDLVQALPALAIVENSVAIEDQRWAADAPAFQAGAPHAGAHPLDDQVAFELSDRSDDDHDGPAQRAAGVDLLAEADELDVEPVQLVEHFEEVLHRSGDPVRSPDQDDIEAAAAGVGHHLVQSWPASFHAADLVGHLRDDLVAALRGHLAEVV